MARVTMRIRSLGWDLHVVLVHVESAVDIERVVAGQPVLAGPYQGAFQLRRCLP
jgi:hypothetical protein